MHCHDTTTTHHVVVLVGPGQSLPVRQFTINRPGDCTRIHPHSVPIIATAQYNHRLVPTKQNSIYRMPVPCDIQRLPMVREFYADKEIFITGGTGYLGKVLIEKLLRSCPDLKRIFLLIRPKKGHSVETRLKLFTEDQVFDLVRSQNPKALQKLACVAGDVRQLGLGIDPVDFERIRQCQVVIHGAATVRFDELLAESLLMNTRGTRETLRLAQRMDRVQIFNHVSTTFCNPDHPSSEERLYPVHVHWSEAIRMAETLDTYDLEAMSKVLMNGYPNTYTFSKRLSEHLVNEMRKDCSFPVVILRPSVGK